MAAGIGFLLAIILGNLIYLCIKSYKKKKDNQPSKDESDSQYFLDAQKLWDANIGGYSNPSKAIELLSKAITLNQKDNGYYSLRGLAYAQLKNYDLAIQDYTTAINIAPNSIFYIISRGRIYAAIKNIKTL